MTTRTLGRSGLSVSQHGLGTMTWGRETDEHEALDLLAMFLESGGNYLDTAPFFGEGRAESIVGRVLQEFDRETIVLGSHAGVRAQAERRADTSRGHLLHQLDRSLRAMHVDHLDIWFVDRFDALTPPEEVVATMEYAVTSGRVRYLGLGNHSGWQLAHVATLARDRVPVIASTMEYSLVQRGIERDHLPACRALGIDVVPWSPLGRGVLTGKYRTGIPADSRGASPQWGRFVQTHLDAQGRRVVEAVATAASGLGLAPIDIALAWMRARDGVTASLLGPRTVAQLRHALANVDLELPAELVSALDEVSAPVVEYPETLNAR